MAASRFVLVFVTLAMLVLALQASKEEMEKLKADCKTELKLTDAEVEAMDSNITSTYTEKTKCLIKCIFEKMEMFKNNKVNEGKVMAAIRNGTATDPAMRQKAIRILNQCKRLSGNSACDTAAMIFSCARNGAQKIMQEKKQ